MDKIRNELIQRHEHKLARSNARVRQREKFSVRAMVFKDEEVEIDRPRTHVYVARASEGVFDAQETRHHLIGREKRRAAQFRNHVEKRRLVLIFDRLRFVNTRESNNIQASVEHAANGEQQVSSAIAEIGTKADVSVLYHRSMSQLLTLIWLKWRLLRNSLRSSKAVMNKVASVLGTLLALALSLMVAMGLGVAAYALTRPDVWGEALRHARTPDLPETASVEFIFFSIFGILYLMWATVPLSIGGSKQFDAGKLLMYPITLRKLFAVDFVSELTTLHSVFAVPAVLALCIGAGLGSGNLTTTLIIAFPAILFGIALSKWLSTVIGSLVRRKRARGETIIAMIGAIAGLSAAAAGQVAPILVKHAESIRYLRWTPPGAAAFLLTTDAAADQAGYATALIALTGYAVVLVIATYWLARRAALGLEGKRRRKVSVQPTTVEAYSGWQLPFMSPQLSAVLEKELRYAMRNAQIRMMALMPLILIVIRFVNSRRWAATRPQASGDFLAYGSGLLPLGGVLYVFLILAGLSCNIFAFEEGGMRTLILSPVDRRKILFGKNIAVILIALVFSTALLILNEIIFRDLRFRDILFVALSFVVFAALSSSMGNWISLRFPKHMRFSKRLNVTGVAGLLLIPMVIVLATPPLLATVVGFVTRNVLNVYTSLAVMALLSVGFYFLALNFQGRSLAAREIEILEAVREPADE